MLHNSTVHIDSVLKRTNCFHHVLPLLVSKLYKNGKQFCTLKNTAPNFKITFSVKTFKICNFVDFHIRLRGFCSCKSSKITVLTYSVS